MAVAAGRVKIPLSGIHQAAADVLSTGERAIPNSSLKGKERQCISCGRCWPWTVFGLKVVHQTSHVCTRCARPDLEVQRWAQLHEDMNHQLLQARKKVIKRQPALRADSSTISHSPSVSIRNNLSIPAQAGTPVPGGLNAVPTALSIAINETRRGGGRLMKEELLDRLGDRLTLKDWGEIREPDRATIWLQMNYCVAPSSITTRQVDIFSSYTQFINSIPEAGPSRGLSTSSKHLNPALEGIELIKLCLKIWSDAGVEMQGAPNYTLSGFQAKENVNKAALPIAVPQPPVTPVQNSTVQPLTHSLVSAPKEPRIGKSRPSLLDHVHTISFSSAHSATSSLQPDPAASSAHDRSHLPTTKGKEKAIDNESGRIREVSTMKRRRSSGVPEGVEVITIDDDDDDDDYGGDDEWGILKPGKRFRADPALTERLSTSTMTTGHLTIQPKPKITDGSYSSSLAVSVIGSDAEGSRPAEQDEWEIGDDPIEDADLGNGVQAFSPVPAAEEEIDELDEDDDLIPPMDLQPTNSEIVAKQEPGVRAERRNSLNSEAEVGDLLL
ncbi:hypothetical protein I316_06793 [Kwoniella heveanensis BCC8398]|uniref:Uncharacterized protein n=1 Tax=Kwoniella heveanensis BCC8398 TaxID=1296120 RepID=A0A1B9GKK2_9TREE|nr:hypothetical protein I316_06793 [Kwoniella heveanensis BCC8398]